MPEKILGSVSARFKVRFSVRDEGKVTQVNRSRTLSPIFGPPHNIGHVCARPEDVNQK